MDSSKRLLDFLDLHFLHVYIAHLWLYSWTSRFAIKCTSRNFQFTNLMIQSVRSCGKEDKTAECSPHRGYAPWVKPDHKDCDDDRWGMLKEQVCHIDGDRRGMLKEQVYNIDDDRWRILSEWVYLNYLL